MARMTKAEERERVKALHATVDEVNKLRIKQIELEYSIMERGYVTVCLKSGQRIQRLTVKEAAIWLDGYRVGATA
jgi:hypothetical protein